MTYKQTPPQHASGTVVSVRGSVVDVRFDTHLPPIYSVLRAAAKKETVIEVLEQSDAHHVRGIALTPTQSHVRGIAFLPTAGLVMRTRSRDLDPGLVNYLARTEQMTAAKFQKLVNQESGLLSLSESSSDLRDLLAHEAKDVRATEAVALFCCQAKKWIGAFAAALGCLDSLVFNGGIGESAPLVRQRICEGVEFLGLLQLDALNKL